MGDDTSRHTQSDEYANRKSRKTKQHGAEMQRVKAQADWALKHQVLDTRRLKHVKTLKYQRHSGGFVKSTVFVIVCIGVFVVEIMAAFIICILC